MIKYTLTSLSSKVDREYTRVEPWSAFHRVSMHCFGLACRLILYFYPNSATPDVSYKFSNRGHVDSGDLRGHQRVTMRCT